MADASVFGSEWQPDSRVSESNASGGVSPTAIERNNAPICRLSDPKNLVRIF